MIERSVRRHQLSAAVKAPKIVASEQVTPINRRDLTDRSRSACSNVSLLDDSPETVFAVTAPVPLAEGLSILRAAPSPL